MEKDINNRPQSNNKNRPANSGRRPSNGRPNPTRGDNADRRAEIARRRVENAERRRAKSEEPVNEGFFKNKSSIIRFGIVAAFVIIIIICCTIAFKIGYGLFQNDAMEEAPGQEVFVTIPENAGSDDVAELLKYNGLIKDETMFKLRCKIYDAKFNPGTYTLNTSMTTEEMLDELRYPVDTGEEEETTAAYGQEQEE